MNKRFNVEESGAALPPQAGLALCTMIHRLTIKSVSGSSIGHKSKKTSLYEGRGNMLYYLG